MPKLFGGPREKTKALVAAATRVDFQISTEAARLLAREETWQKDAVTYYDAIGELHYGLNLFADSIAKIWLYAAEKPAKGNTRPSATEDQRAIDALARLTKGPGISEMLKKGALNLKQTGVCYLVGLDPKGDDPEAWFIGSINEVKTENEQVRVKFEGKWRDLITPSNDNGNKGDFLLKIHIPHPNDSDRPDCPMRAVATVCEGIILLDRADRGTSLSRLLTAGIFAVSEDFTVGPIDPTKDGSGNEEDTKDPFTELLIKVARTNMVQDGNAASQIPIIIRGPYEQVKDGMQHITFDRKADDKHEERMVSKLKRLAHGLDLPVEFIFGLGEANHWGAGQIEESDWRSHLQPFAEMFVNALTTGFYRPALEAAGMSPEDADRFLIWYDPSAVIARPNRQKDALDAFREGAISWEAFRNELGFDADDAPTEEELMVRITLKQGTFDPELVRYALKILEERQLTSPPDEQPEDGPLEPPPPSGGGGEAPAEETSEDEGSPTDAPEQDAAVTAAASSNLQALARSLAGIDRSLRDKLSGAADSVLQRAIEKAGAKVVSYSKKDKSVAAALSGTMPAQVCARLGREWVRNLGLDDDGLLKDAFSGFKDKYLVWTEASQERALVLVPMMTDAERSRARSSFATARIESWEWFESALFTLASIRLYDPHPSAPQAGEADSSTLVPYGLIRGATQLAGGSSGLQERGGSFVDVKGPVGGIGQGAVVIDLLTRRGIRDDGYIFVYGQYPRTPFEPHADLDGTEFATWEDPALLNGEGWPATPYFYPGDHDGCTCDFELKLAEEEAA